MIRSLMRAENLYYLSNWFHRHKLTPLGDYVSAVNKILNCCNVNCRAQIGKGLHIAHGIGLVIGGKIKVGNNCVLYHNVTLGKNQGFCPIIEDNVIIYPHTIIAGDIVIPKGSVIPAKSTLITKRASIWDQKQKKLKPLHKKNLTKNSATDSAELT